MGTWWGGRSACRGPPDFKGPYLLRKGGYPVLFFTYMDSTHQEESIDTIWGSSYGRGWSAGGV